MSKKHSRSGFVRYVFTSVAFLFLVQLSVQMLLFFLFSEEKGGLVNARFLLWQGIQTWPVIAAILSYLVLYLILLIVISMIAFFMSRFLVVRLKMRVPMGQLAILIVLLLYGCLLVINAYRYPLSIVKLPIMNDWQGVGNVVPYYISIALSLFTVLLAAIESVISAVQEWWRSPDTFRRLSLVLSLILLSFLLGYVYWPKHVVEQLSAQQSHSRPHIILIGLDSVRMDIVEDQKLRGKHLPNLSAFLEDQHTAWFTNAFTPIGRTFAAWYALMSGKEPKLSGVRYNLQQLTVKQKEATIVPLLNEAGYRTVYGSDEKRFSTIDKSYGFKEIFGPPPGAADWIMSFMEDSPIHNLLRKTPLSPIFLPYTNANRASASVYEPETFVKEVERQLTNMDSSQPLFLSLHLCLAHWPYTWATSDIQTRYSQIVNYVNALESLDIQFGAIMDTLKNSGVLKNSLVFVFTDHGEGLMPQSMKGDDDPGFSQLRELIAASNDRKYGHGTDLNIELLVSQGASAYEISDAGLLQVKQNYHSNIIRNKQKGVTNGNYIVASTIRIENSSTKNQKFMALDISESTGKPEFEGTWNDELVQLKNDCWMFMMKSCNRLS